MVQIRTKHMEGQWEDGLPSLSASKEKHNIYIFFLNTISIVTSVQNAVWLFICVIGFSVLVTRCRCKWTVNMYWHLSEYSLIKKVLWCLFFMGERSSCVLAINKYSLLVWLLCFVSVALHMWKIAGMKWAKTEHCWLDEIIRFLSNDISNILFNLWALFRGQAFLGTNICVPKNQTIASGAFS